jgi:hypothetical protein
MRYRVTGVHPTGLTVARDEGRCPQGGLDGVFAYMDDTRVGSPDRQTHLHHLEAFFKALAINANRRIPVSHESPQGF